MSIVVGVSTGYVNQGANVADRAHRYQAPFDRHDWVVDRCGTRMRYIIDFYTGRSTEGSNVSFFLDVRPSLDNWEGWKMRASRIWQEWMGGSARNLSQNAGSTQSQQTQPASNKSSQ